MKKKYVSKDPRGVLQLCAKTLYHNMRKTIDPFQISYVVGVMRRLASQEIREQRKMLGEKQWRNPRWKK
jgi:hypothetical protein